MKKRSFIKLFFFFAVALIVPLMLLGLVSISLTQGYLRDTIDQNNLRTLNQTRFNIELILNQVNQLSLTYDMNIDLALRLDEALRDESSTYHSTGNMRIIRAFTESMSRSRPYIHSIYIYFNSGGGNYFSSTGGVTSLSGSLDTSWHDEYTAHNANDFMWTSSRFVKNFAFESPAEVITVYRRTFTRRGVIVLNLLPGDIESQLYDGDNNHTYHNVILDESGHVVLQNMPLPFQNEMDWKAVGAREGDSFSISGGGETYIVNKVHSPGYGWTFLSIAPQSELYRLPTQMTLTLALVMALCLLLGLLLTYHFSRQSTRPLNTIVALLDAAKQDMPLPAVDQVKYPDEYSYIADNLVRTFVEQHYMKVTLSERIYRTKTLELLALQSQINPHFLFNALKAIYWKSYSLTEGANDVSRMVELLSDLLSYTLDAPHSLVTVSTELHHTRNYLELQKMRFKDKFDTIWQVDESVLDEKTIKLLLQPVVENSVFHGVMEKDSPCRIKVRIMRRPGFLRFTVIDNGMGMTRETLTELRAKISAVDTARQEIEHIGLYNTCKRVKLTYGEQARVTVRSRRGMGTVVDFLVPSPIPDE